MLEDRLERNDVEASEETDDINERIARAVRSLRAERGLSLDALATRSGVSRSMISLIERGESSATAVVLDKLATGLSVPLARLFDASPRPAEPAPLSRRADQPLWRDPESGYVRRNVSPAGHPSPIQIVEVSFPPGARVAYETGARDVKMHQQVWVIDGTIQIGVGDEPPATLQRGDCLAMRLEQPIVFHNPGRRPARYMVVIVAEPIGSRKA
ncbi:MAG TPA: XRE family transcriptional regulator [Candidatus Acidoferrum sp.]|nr:XRE family transcriptional regulator [Candidatus Acidoferrum sp.]